MKALLVVDDSQSSTRVVEEVRNTAWPVGTKFLVLAVAPRHFIPPPPAPMLTFVRGNGRGWRDEALNVVGALLI
jgi:hypothetical protein